MEQDLVFGIPGILQPVFGLFQWTKRRIKIFKSNSLNIVEAVDLQKKASASIFDMENELRVDNEIEAETRIRRKLKDVETYRKVLDKADEKLKTVEKFLATSSTISRFLKANKVSKSIEEERKNLREVLDKADNFLDNVASSRLAAMDCRGSYDRAQRPGNVFVTITRTVGRVFKITNLLPTQQKSPPWSVVDYRAKDISGEPAFKEGKIRHLLLQGARGKCSSSHHHTVIQITGDSGIGKTCAVQGVIRDDDGALRTLYCDEDDNGGGIHYININEHNPAQQVIESLAHLVETSAGSKELAHLVRSKNNVLFTVYLFLELFSGRHCLFIIDDAFEQHPDWNHISKCLTFLSECSYRSAVMFIRKRRVLRDEQDVGFTLHIKADPVGLESWFRFICCAGLGQHPYFPLDKECSEFVDEVLNLCGGKVFCINYAGLYCKLFRETLQMSLCEALKGFLRIMKDAKEEYKDVPLTREIALKDI